YVNSGSESPQTLAEGSLAIYLVDRTKVSATLPNPDLLWLDASDLTSAGALSSWADKSGAGNTVTQATSGSQPVVVLDELNGLPVVRFDGENDRLSTSLSTTSPEPITYLIVAKSSATTFPN